MKVVNNLDINKIQGQVNNLSKTITTAQELIDQFQLSKKNQLQKMIDSNGFGIKE